MEAAPDPIISDGDENVSQLTKRVFDLENRLQELEKILERDKFKTLIKDIVMTILNSLPFLFAGPGIKNLP